MERLIKIKAELFDIATEENKLKARKLPLIAELLKLQKEEKK